MERPSRPWPGASLGLLASRLLAARWLGSWVRRWVLSTSRLCARSPGECLPETSSLGCRKIQLKQADLLRGQGSESPRAQGPGTGHQGPRPC